MLTQSAAGLLLADRYRDVEWIRMTWRGNDWVTLVLAVPLLLVARTAASGGSARGQLFLSGILAYAAYNYAYYLFGAALNVFFPLYVIAVVFSAIALISSLDGLDVTGLARSVRPDAPVRTVGAYFVLVGVSLAAVWLAMWGAYVFAGRPTPIEPEAFKLVAALDLVIMVPLLTVGGVWLSRREPWGYVVASIAAVQASLYLLVLAVNSMLFLSLGLAEPPGELPIWGTLALVTSVMTLVLFSRKLWTEEA